MMVHHPDGTTIVEHSDGTRITSYTSHTEVAVPKEADQETGSSIIVVLPIRISKVHVIQCTTMVKINMQDDEFQCVYNSMYIYMYIDMYMYI